MSQSQPTTSPGPLSAVLAAVDAGARALPDICKATGLNQVVASAAIEHLARTGRLTIKSLAPGCASTGCSGCASANCAVRDVAPMRTR